MSPAIVFIALFIAVFGIAYLFFSTRNKERLALIEKGADASIFIKGKKGGGVPMWKYFALNTAVVLIGIGIAIFLGNVLVLYAGLEEEIAMPGAIFLLAGIGLFTGLSLSKRLEEGHKEQSYEREM